MADELRVADTNIFRINLNGYRWDKNDPNSSSPRLSISEYNGRVYFTVWLNKSKGDRTSWKIRLTFQQVYLLVQAIKRFVINENKSFSNQYKSKYDVFGNDMGEYQNFVTISVIEVGSERPIYALKIEPKGVEPIVFPFYTTTLELSVQTSNGLEPINSLEVSKILLATWCINMENFLQKCIIYETNNPPKQPMPAQADSTPSVIEPPTSHDNDLPF